MLRLFPEHIQIGLGTSYASIGIVKSGRVSYFQFQYVQSEANAEYPWHPSLTLIQNWLAALGSRRANIHVYLSSELAALHSLPWRDELTEPSQQRLIAINHWQKVYGQAAADWDVQISSTAYGQPWLASGVDAHLLAQLQALSGQTLKSVQSVTISLFNQLHQQCKARDYWFVVREPHRINAIYMQNKRLLLLRTLPVDAINADTLNDVLLREIRLAGLADLNASVYVIDGLNADSPHLPKLSTNVIRMQAANRLIEAHEQSAQAYLLGTA